MTHNNKSNLWVLNIILGVLILFCSPSAKAQVEFDKWFENQSLRIDYFLAGNTTTQQFFLDELRWEPHWSGSHNQTIDTLYLGTHRVEVFDKQTGLLLYAHGFCTLFQEWQTTQDAIYLSRAFEQVTRIPYPKSKVLVSYLQRDTTNSFVSLYSFDVDPTSIFINRTPSQSFPTTKLVDKGNPNQKLDIAFIAEGYTDDQMEKFRSDVTRLYDYLITQKPFDELIENINIWAIESPSESEGPSNPGKGDWKITPAQSSFYTFGIERYLTTTKYKSVMDVASNAPGDIVYILVNSSEYGGGGIYNHYNVTTSDHSLSREVFIHELGHGLAGLGDEYYTSDVAYQNFYPAHLEPWEPNLTTLVNFKGKWAKMVDGSTPIPTPPIEKYKLDVGVFEGGGYSEKGVFRPYIDCRMKSNSALGFCPVCQGTIRLVVKAFSY